MKLTLGLLLFFVAQTWALNSYSQKARLNLNMKNTNIIRVLEEIENQTDYYFLFNYEQLKSDKKIDIELNDSKVDEILDYILKETDLGYVIKDRQIVIAKDETASRNNQLQQKTVTGKVTDSSGQPLPGVSIIIKGTTQGTISDFDGKFSLANVSNETSLIFSFVGMKPVEIFVNGRNDFSVVMEEDAIGIEEVIAVGYGTQKKSDLTGSISSVKSKDIKERPAVSFVQKMQGKAAGVDITQKSGRPGEGSTVRIRGRRSFSATNDPLYVIDGIPLQGGINDINPNDITSIEILKDAASCAIYGSRGANGVILVTTKRGKAGETLVTYDGSYGITQLTRMVDMMNGEEFAEMRREAYRATDSYIDDEHLFEDRQLANLRAGIEYDYLDLVFKNGSRTDHQFGISGGDVKTQFALSLGYYDEEGIVSNMGYTRYTMRLNLDHQVNDWLKVGTSTTISRSEQEFGSDAYLNSALRNSPLGEAYDLETGELVFHPTTDGVLINPLFDVMLENFSDNRKTNRIFSSVYADLSLGEYLKYKINFGVDIDDYRRGRFRGMYSSARNGAPADAMVENHEEFVYTLENIFTYNRTFHKKHKLNITAMQSIQDYAREHYSSDVGELPYEAQRFYNMDSGALVNGIKSQLEEWQIASFMGRLNYDFDSKYLLQATLRADGSSKLAAQKKWGYFPSAALGWRIINESFMENVDWLSALKFRTSYGVTGNSDIDPYSTQGALKRTIYSFDEASAYGYSLDDIPNTDLKWEKTATWDAGIDFGLWEGRLSGSLDFYRANTTDLLMNRQLPPTSGYTRILENIGRTRNTGFEITLDGVIMDNSDGFKWSANVNWHTNNEEIVELYGGKNDDIGNKWFIGEPLTVFYNYEKIGIWQLDEEAEADSYGFNVGEIKVKDQNEDGVIDSEDRVIIGSDIPKWSMGVTNRLEYKGFDLSVFVYTRYGSKVYDIFRSTSAYNSLFGRYNNIDIDYWTPNNPTNDFPRPNQNQESPRYGSSAAYFDGTFVKVRNITLGYNFPKSIVNGLGVGSLRVYFTADHPFTFSKFKGYDPEDDNGRITFNVPSTKAFMFGVNVSL